MGAPRHISMAHHPPHARVLILPDINAQDMCGADARYNVISPQCAKFTYMSTSDEISKSVANIGNFLKKQIPAVPFPTLGNIKLEALRKWAENFRRLADTDVDMDKLPRVEVEKIEYKPERLRCYPHINTTLEPKQIEISWGKAKLALIHTTD